MSDGRARVVALALIGIILTGCSTSTSDGGGGGDLATSVAEQTGLDEERARCVADYAERTFAAADLDALAADGLAGLPRNQWEVYQRILSSCAYADDAQLRAVAGPAGAEP